MISLEKLRRLLYVMMTSDTPLTGTFLANAMEISLKSFQNTLNECNQILRKKGIQIISNRAKGYVLTYEDPQEYQKLKDFIVRNHLVTRWYMNDQHYRVNDFIRTLLYHENGVFLSDYAKRTYYSESTISKDLKDVKRILATYDLKLMRKKNKGFLLSGHEFSLRCCMCDQMRIYRNNSILIDQNDEFPSLFSVSSRFYYNVSRIVEDTIRRSDIVLSRYGLQYAIWWTALGKSRTDHTADMIFSEEDTVRLKQSSSFQIADAIYHEIAQNTGLFYQINNVLGLTIVLGSLRDDFHIQKNYFNHEAFMDYMHQYYPKIYQNRGTAEEKQLLTGLERHLAQIDFARKWHVNNNLDEIHQIQRNSVRMVEHATLAARFFRQQGIVLNEVDIAGLYYIFSAYVRHYRVKSTCTLKTLLAYGRSMDQAQCLAAFLRHYSGVRFDVDVVPYTKVQNYLPGDYECIVRDADTAVPASSALMLDVHYDGFYVNPQLWHQNEPFTSYLVHQIFKKEYFFRKNIHSRDEAFAAAEEIAADLFHLPEEYMNEVEERDALLPSERNNQIVILKSFSVFSSLNAVSVIVCNHSFIWHEMECRILIIDHMSHDLENFSSSMYHRLVRNYKDLPGSSDEITYALICGILSGTTQNH